MIWQVAFVGGALARVVTPTSGPDDGSMAVAVVETTAAATDIAAVLVAAGWTEPNGHAEIVPCEDLGRESQPAAAGSATTPTGAPPTLDDAVELLDLLVDAGWTAESSAMFTDGVATERSDDVPRIAVRRGDQFARFGFVADPPIVSWDLVGACLPNSASERDLYAAIGPWELTAPSTTDTVPSAADSVPPSTHGAP